MNEVSPDGSRLAGFFERALQKLQEGFAELPPVTPRAAEDSAFNDVLQEVAIRLRENYPYFHPLYAGQMLKPPHPVARLAYALAMTINPNNHALDGGRASSAMEKEAVSEIAGMFGWRNHLSHLTGGGTMANLEALWVASQLRPGKITVASEQAHYTHERLSRVLGLAFEKVPCDFTGRMDLLHLERRLEQGGIGTVVATIGTTLAGAVDPLPGLLALRKRFGFHLHADASYGGYFVLGNNLSARTADSFRCLGEVDSIAIDPHKHGLQPFGCGCILFADPSVGRFYRHDSPYTYFTSSELHLGEISLECSRPGAAAVALWATQRFLPLTPGGEFSQMLAAGREAAVQFHQRLSGDRRFLTAFPPELDIVLWTPQADSVTQASKLGQEVFEEAGRRRLHLALANVPIEFFDGAAGGMKRDAGTVRCLRSVLMKPEHKEWLETMWKFLDEATTAVLRRQ